MEKNLVSVPTVAISRTAMDISAPHKLTMNLGDIVPVFVKEVMPAQSTSLDLAAIVRMSTPIAPIMDDIVMEFFAFFVPKRLVWDHWKNFMGESDVAGYNQNTEYLEPQMEIDLTKMGPQTLGDYFGLPYIPSAEASDVHSLTISCLRPRGYVKIYNRWFRNQNVEGLVPVTTGDLDGTGTAEMGLLMEQSPFVAYKKPDYFTTCLPYAQKGAPVALPLGTYAPVVTLATEGFKGTVSSPVEALKFRQLSGADAGFDTSATVIGLPQLGTNPLNTNRNKLSTVSDDGLVGTYVEGDSDQYLAPSNLWADLSNATAATINDIRLAFATQKALEKDALYGSRYWEMLYGHFGVKSPDASLQDPEYLGGIKAYINVDQVLQTTGFAAGDSSSLGTPGANSVTGIKDGILTKSFSEWGDIFVLAVARQASHTYSNGLDRQWLRRRRFDYYLPVFANLGNQAVSKIELSGCAIDATSEKMLKDSVFGYQEAWAEYRYTPARVSGYLNPKFTNSLDYWTLADEDPTDEVTLGQTFLKETRDNLSRALVTGSSGPDFIVDLRIVEHSVKPMPLHSVPGLVDHH